MKQIFFLEIFYKPHSFLNAIDFFVNGLWTKLYKTKRRLRNVLFDNRMAYVVTLPILSNWKHCLIGVVCLFLINIQSKDAYSEIYFEKHVIKSPRIGADNNTNPGMVLLDDVDEDGSVDLIVSHVSHRPNYVHPYVAWYKGPDFEQEFIILDKNTVGVNSRVYRFVMFDVDNDGKKDLIGQGYNPYHNGNKWYKKPENPTLPWSKFYDYGVDLSNGHDIMLWDIDNNGEMDLILMDSHSGKIIVKPIPKGGQVKSKWPFYVLTYGNGMTHYMSLYDVSGDGLKDIVIGKEEDGGDGIRWYEHPGTENANTIWKDHFVLDADFTKVFARDLDMDGDIDFIGTGEFFTKSKESGALWRRIWRFIGFSIRINFDNRDVGWYEQVSEKKYLFHEFDKKDNANDIIGGHNSKLVDVDGDGDEDLITGGVDIKDMTQRFRWYENRNVNGKIKWIEHPIGVTSAQGWKPGHGFYCGEMTWGDIDGDGDRDLVYSGVGSGFLGWFENKSIP